MRTISVSAADGAAKRAVRGLEVVVVSEPLDFLCDFPADQIADKTDRYIFIKWVEDAVP